MKVLVIGGAGFIGRSVVAALIGRGVDVIIGTRRPRDPAYSMSLHCSAVWM